MKKLLITLGLLNVLLLCICICACKKSYVQGEFAVNFMINGEVYSTIYADFGDKIDAPEVTSEEGKIFKGWYKTEDYIEKWNFNSEIIKDKLTLYGHFVNEDEETFNILYYDCEHLVNYETVLKNTTSSLDYKPNKQGYDFIGWFKGDALYDFDSEVTEDINLYASWEIINYSVKFIAEDEIISECYYTVEEQSVTVPAVPQKTHYSGEWLQFELLLEDIEVKAVYTPITYTAVFIADDIVINEFSYTIEDEFSIPDVPEKSGYNGVWSDFSVGGDITVTAIYYPIEYTVTYIADEQVVSILKYTVENKEIISPAIPERDGYSGKWEDAELNGENVTVYALYEPITYYIKFVADNKIIAEIPFDIENKEIQEPQLPQKEGYTAQWESYEFALKDITVKTIYTPITYVVSYLIDGVEISSTDFTVEDTEISLPEIEDRPGYSFEWENYIIIADNFEIRGYYKPITYYITFMSGDTIVDIIDYTVENNTITEPEPPEKDGFSVAWEPYELTIGDITVKAIYTPVATDKETEKFLFELQEDDTYSITGYSGENESLIFPSTYKGKPVSSIGIINFDNAEVNKSDIKRIEIREGIKRINDDAFLSFTALVEIKLPLSLISIGKHAFAYCPLKEIDLPENLTLIDEQAFAYSGLVSVTIPDKIKEINNIFYNCSELKNVVLGNGVEIIKTNAFYSCSSLSSIIIPESVALIESEAFYGASLENAYFEKVNGWIFCDENLNYINEVNDEIISDTSTAALWLTKVFKSRYWKNEL